jgi:transglutaminase-like putative cysteine protease
MIEALRTLGVAARFVSGYLHLEDDDDRLVGGNTHAWVQANVPGPAWVDFDPSTGLVGNQNLVRVAVASRSNCLAMESRRELVRISGRGASMAN